MSDGRRCLRCKQWKSRGEFHNSATRSGGMEPYCKGCYSKRHLQKQNIRNLRKTITEILSVVLQQKTENYIPEGLVRRCSFCKIWIPLSSFGASKNSKHGLNSICRLCQRTRLRERREIDAVYRDKIICHNRNRTDAQKLKYKENYRRRMAEDESIAIKTNNVRRRWYREHREEQNKKRRDEYAQNSGPIKEAVYQWRKDNPDKVIEIGKRNRENNGEKIKEGKRLDWQKRKENITHHLSDTIRRSMCRGIKKQRTPLCWEKLVDYTIVDLKKHLEAMFLPEMTWENHSKRGWHIDHIIPISAFNYTSPQDFDFKRCWALSNLQPLWAKDNLQKNKKLTRPFQPSLALQMKIAPGV